MPSIRDFITPTQENSLRELAINVQCEKRFQTRHNHGFITAPARKAPSVVIGGKRVTPLRLK